MDAENLISRFGLKPHPEGGHYFETFRAPSPDGGRGVISAIYYLLKRGELSAWHRIDAVEIWHFYAGDNLRIYQWKTGKQVESRLLGVTEEAEPQIVVPPGVWQSARTEGAWTLVGCTVAPAFDFAKFELAPPHWPLSQ